MKSNAPWSVKGIERDARETAKEAAQREGMTVGAWLNQMIYSAGDPERAGAIEGLKVDDIVTAIDHLSQRVASAESKSAAAVEDLAKNFGGVVERIQRLERVKPPTGSNADLDTRVAKIEEKSSDRQRIDALKALEKAVGQIALQFETSHKSSLQRVETNEKQLQELANRVNANAEDEGTAGAIGFLKDAVDGMSARIARAERIASQASRITSDGENVDEEFVERTGKRLRVLGDEIKRGGDQIRSLETTITKLSGQIDAAERRSSEGVQKVAETISELRDQFAQGEGQDSASSRGEIEAAIAAATKRTDDRIASLQNSFEHMISRLEGKARNENAADSQSDDQPASQTGAKALLHAGAPPASAEIDDDIDDDLDADFEDAFAAIDLDEDQDVEPQAAAVENDAEDEFSFDLDAEETADTISPDSSEADDILSQVQEAFGETPSTESKPAARAAKAEPEQSDNAADESGLDAVLAELDGMGFSGEDDDDANQQVEDEETPIFGRKAADESADPQPEESNPADRATDAPAPDFLKDARRKAKAAAAAAALEGQTKKRKLTPKQRAILGARIRRKRLEAEKADGAVAGGPPDATGQSTPIENEAAPSDVVTPDKPGLLASLAAMLPFLGKKGLDEQKRDDESDVETGALELESKDAKPKSKQHKPDQDEAIEDGADAVISEDGNPNLTGIVSRTLDKAKAKPVTLALGAAILLAVLALVFLVKDLASGPNQSPALQADATGGVGVTGAGPALKDAPAAEVPTAPLVKPRALYLESISALRTAATDAEERNALQGLQEAAALGHPPAQLQIGELYKIGQGFEKDPGQARAWYERAANGGNVLAMHRMGVMTARGGGGPVDLQASIGWFEKAGNFGLVDSQYNLGATFHPSAEGIGDVQDRGRAYFWYSLAAANGDAQAGALAAGLGEAMTPEARAALDAEVGAWTPLTPDPDANELVSAS